MPNVNGIYTRARTKSEHRAPRRHRPEALNTRLTGAEAANAHVPIVQVDGGIAVAGHEANLVPSPRPFTAGGCVDDAVLVRGPVIESTGPMPGHGHTAIDSQRLEPRIDDEPLGRRRAHDGGINKERMFEGVEGLAVAALVARVVGIHEDVRARLQLGVDPARSLVLVGTRARPGDGLGF